MKFLDILIAIFVSFTWGSNFVVVKLGAAEVPSFITLAIRFFVTAIIILPFVKKPKLPFKELYITSLVFTSYVSFVYLAIYLGASAKLAVIIMQLNAPLTIILAKFLLGEDFTFNSIIGILLSLVGVIIIIYNPNLESTLISIILLLGGVSLNALFNIQSRKYSKLPPLDSLFWYSLIGTPHLIILSLIFEGNPIDSISGNSYVFWSSVFYSVSMAGILGLTGWIYLLQKYPVHKVMPYNLLVPLFGVSCAILVLKETISIHFIIGGMLIITGVMYSQKKVSS